MSKKILIIGTVWPEPSSSAAGMRMLQLISLLQKDKYTIIFACPAIKSPHRHNLEELNVQEDSIELNNSSFDLYIKKLNPSIVIFDRFMMEEQFGWRVQKNCPDALRILNTEDLNCLRKTREEFCLRSETPFSLENLLNQDITKREIASIYRSDLSLVISDFEMNLLRSLFNINSNQIFYLPFLFNTLTDTQIKNWKRFSEREHFVTIGNFKHIPNWDSYIHLKKDIWPIIKSELPQAELHVYGSYPPPKALQLTNKKDGFIVKGWAEDANMIMSNAKVCLAPLRFGAGIKGKLAEAMLNGTPSITTSIGSEGMVDEDLDWNGFIQDNPQEFAKAAVQLYKNEILWNQCQQNGIAIINSRFSQIKFEEKLITTIEKLLSTLSAHRNKNFIGSMLNFHTLRSTEYMSRWIEEKNKSQKNRQIFS